MNEFTEAIGVLAETSKLIYDNCIRVGYSPEQSLELAKVPFQAGFTPPACSGSEDH